MQRDIGTQIQRLLQRRRCEGVVHQELHGMLGNHLCHGRDIGDAQQRIGGCLQPDQLGLGGDGGANGVDVGHRNRCVANSPLREHLVDQPEGAAIGVVGDDQVIAGAQQRAQHAVGGRHTRCERPAEVGVLQCGQRGFKNRSSGVAGTRVLESTAQLADAILGEGRAGIDRHVDRTGLRIGMETAMDGPCGKPLPPRRVGGAALLTHRVRAYTDRVT